MSKDCYDADLALLKCAERIRGLREEKGLTVEQVAEYAGVATGSVSNWENAKKAPGYFSILKLIKLFDENADYIMGLSDDRRIKKIAQ